MLLTATTTKAGEPYDDLDEVYGRMLGQWALEMNHVAAIVGGFNSQQKHVGQEACASRSIRARQQARAVSFLNAERLRGAVVGGQPGHPPDVGGRAGRVLDALRGQGEAVSQRRSSAAS